MSYDDNRDGRDIGMGTGYECGFEEHDEITREADDGYD